MQEDIKNAAKSSGRKSCVRILYEQSSGDVLGQPRRDLPEIPCKAEAIRPQCRLGKVFVSAWAQQGRKGLEAFRIEPTKRSGHEF